jgi:hypothetical protein
MTTPSMEAAPRHQPHSRGIFEADQTFPGMTTFRIFNCVGRLLELRALETELVDAQLRASMEWTLEHHCPSDPNKHAITCPAAHARLRVLK